MWPWKNSSKSKFNHDADGVYMALGLTQECASELAQRVVRIVIGSKSKSEALAALFPGMDGEQLFCVYMYTKFLADLELARAGLGPLAHLAAPTASGAERPNYVG